MVSLTALFALMLLAATVAVLSFDVYADYTSPKKQLDRGVAPYDVICREGLVLADRGSEKIACVNETAMEQLGWNAISNSTTIMPLNYNATKHTLNEFENVKYTTISYEDIPHDGTSPERIFRQPYSSITFPEKIEFGKEFNVTVSWQFFEVNEDDEIDSVIEVHPTYPGTEIIAIMDSPVEFLTPGYELEVQRGYKLTVSLHRNNFPYDATKILSENLTFRVNDWATAPEHNAFGFILSEINYELFYIDNKYGEIILTVVEPEKYKVRHKDGDDIPEWIAQDPATKVNATDQNHHPDNIPESLWDGLLEILQNDFPNQSVDQVMKELGFSDEYIGRFMAWYKGDLKIQNFESFFTLCIR